VPKANGHSAGSPSPITMAATSAEHFPGIMPMIFKIFSAIAHRTTQAIDQVIESRV
jgi:hypothetical protein